MPTFLIRDEGRPGGFREMRNADSLPRSRTESYFPHALTVDGRVIFCRTEDRGKGRLGHRPYTRSAGMKRRGEAQSALGLIALENPQFYHAALDAVSSRILAWLKLRDEYSGGAIRQHYKDYVGKYSYGLGYGSFGRFSDDDPRTLDADRVWTDALEALRTSRPVPSVMNIHDNVPSKLFTVKSRGGDVVATHEGGSLAQTYRTNAKKFRAERKGELFYDNQRDTGTPGRGRAGNGADKALSGTGGMMSEADSPDAFGDRVQPHYRAVTLNKRIAPHYSMLDSYKPVTQDTEQTMRTKFSAISYYRDLDTRAELFGAGPSGTTGTLLASALTFGNLSGELLKQYCLAIMGYLVGGGCHALHESLTVMGYLGGLEYNSSSMLGYSGLTDGGTDGKTQTRRADSGDFALMPASLTSSPVFKRWRAKYYDIAELGGIHWMLSD